MRCGAYTLLLLLGGLVLHWQDVLAGDTLSEPPSAEHATDAGRELAGKPAKNFPPNVHRCVHATTKLAKQTTAGSPCMMCDPALPECNAGCQLLIDNMYHLCNEQCLPPAYFFDPQMTLAGCFQDNLDAIKIKVERCGCNSASSLRGLQSLLVTAAFTLLLASTLFVGS